MTRGARGRLGGLALALLACLGLLAGAVVSPAAAAPGDLVPVYVTNSFGSDPTTQRVFSWETSRGYTDPTVDVVADGGAFTDAATFTGTSTPVPAVVKNRLAQRVTVTGLAPGTTYAYRLGNTVGGVRAYSPTYRFTTAPATDAPFTFVQVTDSQCSTSEYAEYWGPTLRAALDTVPDAAFVLHTGDIVDTPDQAQWDGFFGATGDALAGVAFQPALGNHEGTNALNVAFYQSVFGVDSQNGFPLNYSFTYGAALFLVLNSNYTTTAELARQADWIRSVVAAQGAGKFVIAAFHKGPFGSFHVAEPDVKRIKDDLVPVLEEVGVSLVLQGHDHEYYRSYPIRDGAPVTSGDPAGPISTRDDGVVFLGSKSAGSKVYPALPMPWFATHWTPPSLTDPVDTVFTAITVGTDALQVTAYTGGGQVIDRAVIYRGAVPDASPSPAATTGSPTSAPVTTPATAVSPVTPAATTPPRAPGAGGVVTRVAPGLGAAPLLLLAGAAVLGRRWAITRAARTPWPRPAGTPSAGDSRHSR